MDTSQVVTNHINPNTENNQNRAIPQVTQRIEVALQLLPSK